MSLDGTPYSEDMINLSKQPNSRKPTLLVDFDGVIHDYKGWNGEQPTGAPIENARKALFVLAGTFRLVCFTTRTAWWVEEYLIKYDFPKMKVTNIKEPAVLILDDRAITFTGVWNDELLERIKSFKAYWETTTKPSDHLPLPDVPPVDRP